MCNRRAKGMSRRQFLDSLALAGTAGFLGLHPRLVAAEPPPETTTLRLNLSFSAVGSNPSSCTAPQYVAEALLQSEGFTDVQYVKTGKTTNTALASGEVHIGVMSIFDHIKQVDVGDPIVMLAGAHVGCYELFGTERVRAIRDLKGGTVATARGPEPHSFLAIMLAYVGLDPHKDVNWVVHPSAESIQLLAEGKIDAFMAYPPEPQELRERQIGHVVLNTAQDRPWSQYFCCILAGHREFIRTHPVATKRVLRAILKATDVCALEPERAARFMVDKGYVKRYDYALQSMQDIPYDKWREYDPEDTVRFYALRLHETGIIKSSPQKLIAQGTDWRFLKELKRELKQ